MKSKSVFLAFMVVLAIALPSLGQEDKLGKVEFPNSCSPAVQEKFLRGVAMLHSFYYSAAQKAFEEVAAEDNSCAIAAWGYASILMSNPLQGIGASPKSAEQAQAAIDKGRKMGAKTQRERDYLEAVAAYYEDFANRPERARQLARAKAYEALAAKYPDDDEAQIFYALYLAGTQTASDQTYSAYLKAAAILEKQFAKHPDHPGRRALPDPQLRRAADRRSRACPPRAATPSIAPDAPHALHMPSHIFTRVGAWADSVATNRRSADVAQEEQRPRRGAARAGLHDLRLPAARARRRRAQDLRRGAHADRDQPGARDRAVRARGDAGALRRRARRLARGGEARAEPEQLSVHRGDDAFRARARRGAERRSRRRAEGRRADRGAARPAEGGEERLLGERGRGDAARVASPGSRSRRKRATRRSRSCARPPTSRTGARRTSSRRGACCPRASCSATCCWS